MPSQVSRRRYVSKAWLTFLWFTWPLPMEHHGYKTGDKDITHIIKQEEAAAMIARAVEPRDKALVAFLYLTGARPVEVGNVQREALKVVEEGILLTIPTAKLQGSTGFYVSERTLELAHDAPFMEYLLSWWKAGTGPFFPITPRRMGQIIDRLSQGVLCPYHFRHTRLTKLSRAGATPDEIMYWKGAKSLKSVAPYIGAKPLGRRLVIE